MNHELRYCAARSPNDIDIEFLYQGLHEFPGRLNDAVSETLNAVDEEAYDYILLNYGLCGNGTLDIHHETLPMVMHNLQDCIPVLIGSENVHRSYVQSRPGTFWFSVGWIEGFPLPGSPDYDSRYASFYSRNIDASKRDIIERVLMQNYTHLTYIEWEELGEAVNERGRAYTRACVQSLNTRLGMDLSYDHVVGSPAHLQNFVDGNWEEDGFLVVEPGKHVQIDMKSCKLCT